MEKYIISSIFGPCSISVLYSNISIRAFRYLGQSIDNILLYVIMIIQLDILKFYFSKSLKVMLTEVQNRLKNILLNNKMKQGGNLL